LLGIAEEDLDELFVPPETARATDELEAALAMLDVDRRTTETEVLVPEHVPNAD
jgi:hypothetical protein